MKKSNMLFLILFIYKTSCAIDINILDFGAVPNDLKNDTKAFLNASNFINKNKNNITLIIPSGKYIVGMQVLNSSENFTCYNCGLNSTLTGIDIINLVGCKNIKIIGLGKVEIIFEDKLYFGGFTEKNGKLEKALFEENDRRDFTKMHKLSATIGSFILLKDCNQVTIKNINTNGNNLNLQLGAEIGTGKKPYEIVHTGITIVNSSKISILKSQFNKYGLDGMYISNDSNFIKKVNDNEIKISDCSFIGNGRQGLSIVGAVGFDIKNSKFNNTGIGVIKTAPGCGVDIEPTVGICKKGIFENCEFKNNAGFGVGINDYIIGSSDFIFKNCFFLAPHYYTIGASMPKVKFENCSFYGETIFGYNAENVDEATTFKKCNFYDTYLGNPMYSFGGALLFIKSRASFLKVESCKFLAINNLTYFIDRENYKDVKSNTQFYNNEIISKLKYHRFNYSSLSYGITFYKNIFTYNSNLPILTSKDNYNIFKDNTYKTNK